MLWIFTFGPVEITLMSLIAILLFGRRIPETGRLLRKGITSVARDLDISKENRLLLAYALVVALFLGLCVYWIVKAI